MTKLMNPIREKLRREKKVTNLDATTSFKILKEANERMEKYARVYRKKEKASHEAASKVLLTS